MSETEKLAMLRTLSGAGEDVTDATLQVYLTLAADVVLRRCYPSADNVTGLTVPERYEVTQCEIANEKFLKRGAEGETKHDEDTIKRTYGDADVSPALLKRIVPFAHVLGVPFNEAT